MTNVEKLKFLALKINGANYVAWATNVELYMEADNLSDTIKVENKSSAQAKAKAIMFYAHIKNPAELWKALKERFDNQREINVPHAIEEWKNLRFQDFKKVEEYNSAMLRIVSQLKFCGKSVTEAEKLEKTYITFHKEHSVLQAMYKNCGYKRFSELIVTLLIAEKTNELSCKLYKESNKGKGKEVNLAKYFEDTLYLGSPDFANDFNETAFTDN